MSFSHGKNAALWLNGVKVSQWLRAITLAPTADLHETSVFEQDDKTYISGKQSAQISADGLYEGSEAAADEIFEGLLGGSSGAIFTYLPAGDGAGARMKGLTATQSAYNIDTPATDLAAVHVEAASEVGYESGVVLHPYGAETATDDGLTVDQTASSTGGAAAYLQVGAGSPDAGTLDAKVQHSDDDSVWVDLITFAQVAGDDEPTAQRGSATGTVNRYIRWSVEIAGTDPSFSFLLGFHRG